MSLSKTIKGKKMIAFFLALVMVATVVAPYLMPIGTRAATPGTIVFGANFYAAADGFVPRGSSVTFANASFSQTPDAQSLQVSNRTNSLHGAQADVTLNILPGVEYELSMWVRMNSGSAQMRIGYDIGGMVTTFSGTNAVRTVTDGAWTQLVGRATFPSTNNPVNIFVDTTSGIGSFFIDSVALTQIGETPEITPPESEGKELKVYLDQRRQQIDGFVLSGAFRQFDLLLNGFQDNEEVFWEVLDLVFGHHTGHYPVGHPKEGQPVDPAAKGIGLSIWRNQIGDKPDLWNYLWRQPASNVMAGGGGNQSWGRWFDSASFSLRPFAPNDPDHFAGMHLPENTFNMDDASYRWWFDASSDAAVNWDPDVHPDPFRRTHIPTIHFPLGNPAFERLNDNIGIVDNSVTFVGGQALPGWKVREGGPKANELFDIFDWPTAPGNQAIVSRYAGQPEGKGLSPVDRGQVWASRAAMAYADARDEEMKIMAAAWSGPAWLKSSGRINGGTLVNADWALRAYANFLADYVKGWETIYGVPVWGLSLSNEPEQANHVYSKSGWNTNSFATPPGTADFPIREPFGAVPTTGGMPNWVPTAPSYMPFARDYLGPILAQRGLRTKSSDGTVNGVRLHIGDSQSYGSSPAIFQRFWGTDAEKYVDDYVFHTYSWQSTDGGMVNSAALREWKVRSQMNNSGIIMSEVSTMSGQNANNIYDYRLDGVRRQNGTQSRSDMGSAIAWAQYWNRQLSVLELTGTGQWWAVGFKRPEANWPMLTAPGDQSLENLIYISNDARGSANQPNNPAVYRGGLEGATAHHRGLTGPESEYGDYSQGLFAVGGVANDLYQSSGPEGGYYTGQTFDYRVHSVFWALGHFSKFVRPNWYRVNHDQTPIDEGVFVNNLNLQSSAYVSPEADEDGYYDFSVVVINGTRENQTLDISFPGFEVESIERWETREDVLDASIQDQIKELPFAETAGSPAASNPAGRLTATQEAIRANYVRGWHQVDGKWVRNRDNQNALRAPETSRDIPSHAGSPFGNGMVLKGNVEAWVNGGAVEVPFASMTTFVGRAKANTDFSVDATSEIQFFEYNELEGAAIYNNNVNLTDPRVETTRVPTTSNQRLEWIPDLDNPETPPTGPLMNGWTNDTFASFTFNSLNFGSGLDELIINTSGGVTGAGGGLPGGAEVLDGSIPIKVYIGGELATAPDAAMEVTADEDDRVISLIRPFAGVQDVVIELGAEDSPVVARLNTLTFDATPEAVVGIEISDYPTQIYKGDTLDLSEMKVHKVTFGGDRYLLEEDEFVTTPASGELILGEVGEDVEVVVTLLPHMTVSTSFVVSIIAAPTTPTEPTPTETTSPTQPTTKPTETTKPTDPTTKPTTPTEPGAQPTDPTEPGTQPTTPSTPAPTQEIGESEVAMTVDAQDGLQAVAKMQEDAFSEDVTLRIRRISNDSEEGRSAIATLNSAISGIEQLFLLDIQAITASGASVQPIDGKTVSITMPIPEGFDPARIAVAHIKSSGAVEILRATVKDGMVTFITDSFSIFAIMEIAAADSVPAPGEAVKTGENSTSNVYLILLGTLLIMAVGYKLYIVRKQKMAIAEGMKELESETSDQ